MTQKEARANIRQALSIIKKRIRFPKVSLKDALESDDLRAILKELVSSRIQRIISNQ